MNKKTTTLKYSGYEAPECMTIEMVAAEILCASTRDGQIDALTVENEDPFNWA